MKEKLDIEFLQPGGSTSSRAWAAGRDQGMSL